MSNLGREKKVNVNDLTEEQVRNLEIALSQKISSVLNQSEAILKEFLSPYGIGVKLVAGIAPKGQENDKIRQLIGLPQEIRNEINERKKKVTKKATKKTTKKTTRKKKTTKKK